MKTLLSLCLTLVFSGGAFGQAWHDGDSPTADTEWHRSDGDFGVMLLLTSQPEEFLQNWDKPTEAVDISTTNQITRGKPIVAFVLFTGCQANSNKNCNLEVAFRVLKPSGETYADTGRLELWLEKPAPQEGRLLLGANYLGTIIEPDDPLGEYKIYAAVRDLNSGKQLLTLQRFEALEAEE